MCIRDRQHLGLQLLNGLHDHLGVGIGGEVLKQGGVVHVHLVGAVLAQLGGDAVNVEMCIRDSTMGPPPAEGMLRELMAMGVDEGVLRCV